MWFQLSRFIVDAISQSQKISIAAVCAGLTSIDDAKVSQVVKYFGVLFQHVSRQGSDRLAQYEFSRCQALDLACRIFAVQVLGHGGARVFKIDTLKENFREYYEKVADELDKSEPCMAIHTSWVREDRSQQPVHCYQSKETHTCHRAWESVAPQTIFR